MVCLIFFKLRLNLLYYSNTTLAGVRVGLTRNDALKLAAQTVKGAAEMVLVTGSSPAVLKDQGMLQIFLC